MNQLALYLSTNSISQRQFAESISLDPSVVSRFLRGEARPGLDTAFLIERATGGEVKAESWAKIDGAKV